jgi:CopG family transcriptional regulator/antitoxin EndoAI
MHKRINITLPEETVRLLDRVTAKRERSGFIDRAIRRYVDEADRANLRRRLQQGYERRADRDLGAAQDWFSVDEDGWGHSNG